MIPSGRQVWPFACLFKPRHKNSNNSIDLSIFNKVAFRYNSNGENSLFLNGVKIATTTGVSFSPSTLNSLNFDFGNGSEDFYGKVRNVKVFNKALTDRELEILTIQ